MVNQIRKEIIYDPAFIFGGGMAPKFFYHRVRFHARKRTMQIRCHLGLHVLPITLFMPILRHPRGRSRLLNGHDMPICTLSFVISNIQTNGFIEMIL